MKKVFLILCVLSLCLTLFCSCSDSNIQESTATPISAFTESAEPYSTTVPSTVTEAATTQINPEFSFKNGCFYCATTGEMLFSHNIEEKIAPASLTKLLTASVALFYVDGETEFTVGTELSLLNPRSSLCLIKKGHRLTLRDLITGLLLPSGNDAAYTIAVNVARKIGGENLSDKAAVSFFSELMNSFAKLIGMNSSNFTSPDGWDNKEQYTTVSDLLKLTQFVLDTKQLREIISLDKKYVIFRSGENITWKSTNQLLDKSSRHYSSFATGGKTGTSVSAGNCLISVYNKNNRTYISVVCGADTSDSRYADSNKLFEAFT
ncbi:MAG: D-alanyl-D-alanine carboxypeptidase [Clostridia bacterium]|nr:D-alanyl-D-alanine carboxypeptidase [Clostridia bacterium]